MSFTEKVEDDIRDEAWRAISIHGWFNSHHEAMSVLDEEIHEVKMEVYKKEELRDKQLLYNEVVQVSAVALKWAEQIQLEILKNDA